jgi:replicative DNA helicase
VTLAQLNRGSEQREGKRPFLSDLRESGSIEQDADVVMLLHRPEYYGQAKEDGEDVEGDMEINVAKQRNGPTGIVKAHFSKETGRFQKWGGHENYRT